MMAAHGTVARTSALAVALCLAASCAPSARIEVTPERPAALAAGGVRLQPQTADQPIAAMIAEELTRRGWPLRAADEPAEYLLELAYSSRPARMGAHSPPDDDVVSNWRAPPRPWRPWTIHQRRVNDMSMRLLDSRTGEVAVSASVRQMSWGAPEAKDWRKLAGAAVSALLDRLATSPAGPTEG